MIDSDLAWKISEHEGLAYSILDYFDEDEVKTWGDPELIKLWLEVKPKLERIRDIIQESMRA